MITVKSQKEIQLMRESGKILRDLLLLLESKLQIGMPTIELDKIAYDFITKNGAKPSFLGYGGFPASICVSIDKQVVHGFPSDRLIKEGEIISIDAGVYKNGFHADAARSFYVGKIDSEKKRLIDVTKESFFKGIEGIQEGSALGTIGYQVQSFVEANGFNVVREMVGHGIGKNLHEDPNVPNYGKKGVGIRLKSGMTLAVEPMVNMGTHKVILDGWKCDTQDDLPSAHYENTILITADGVEILTL